MFASVGFKLPCNLWPSCLMHSPFYWGLYLTSQFLHQLQMHQTTKFRFIQQLAWWGQGEDLFCLIWEESYKKICTWKWKVKIKLNAEYQAKFDKCLNECEHDLQISTAPSTADILPCTTTRPALPASCSWVEPTVSNDPALGKPCIGYHSN